MMGPTYFQDFIRDDGTEITVEFSISNYDAGNTYGPPESCYPPEGGEIEIVKAFSDEASDVKLTDAEYERFENWLTENIDPTDYQDYHEYED